MTDAIEVIEKKIGELTKARAERLNNNEAFVAYALDSIIQLLRELKGEIEAPDEPTYRVFHRYSWREADVPGKWPKDIEPNACPPEDCETIAEGCTRDKALDICADFNHPWRTDHSRKSLLMGRYEFTIEDE